LSSSWKSTRSGTTASLTQALFQGPAADGGLYIPVAAPTFDAARIARESGSFQETALRMAIGLLGGEVPASVLEEIVAEALDFPVPVVPIGDDLHVLELFHGPTAAFKDVGARFMASLMERVDPEPDRTRLVVVATSGDTGGAVADAFARRERFKVVVLFPKGGVTPEQRKLFSTLGTNVTAAEVPGTFDDCQALVKAAFRDASAERWGLTAANSINVGRLVPQTFYYVDAVRQGGWSEGCAFSVPSGNLGNLTGGMLAAMAGLPVRRLVSSLNVNDTFLRHLQTGAAESRPARRTISSAMDVSLPNNLERLVSLTGGELERLRGLVWARSFEDDATMACMRRVRAERGYLLDPHAAVGMLGAESYRREQGDRGPMVVLATAHPAKLPDVVEAAVGERPPPPSQMRAALGRPERIVPLENDVPAFLELLDEVSGQVSSRRVGSR
jgi:threonine synthase